MRHNRTDGRTRRKKYLMANDYMLDKVLGKMKEIISIEKFDDTQILIDTDDKLPEDATLKNIVILLIGVIKDDNKFYRKIFLEQTLLLA